MRRTSLLSFLFFFLLLGCSMDGERKPSLYVQGDAEISEVSASNSDSNVPQNTLDGDFDTRWSARGDEEWISFDLARPVQLESVAVAWHKGDARSATFKLEAFNQGIWTEVFEGASSGETLGLESYSLSPTPASRVRLTGYGNTQNDWNSVTEVRITGSADASPDPAPTPAPDPTPESGIYVSPSGNDNNGGASANSPVKTVTRALELRKPGERILLLAGTYPRILVENASGTADDPIIIESAPGAEGKVTVETGSVETGSAFMIEDSSYVTVRNLRMTNAQKGITVYGSQNIQIRNNLVEAVGQEGVAMRRETSYSVIADNTIRDTGKRQGVPYAEGIYIGNGSSKDDETHHITISGNDIYRTDSEAIDVKTPTHHITIENNRIHDIVTDRSGAIVLHLNDENYADEAALVVRNNWIWNISRNSPYNDGNGLVIGAAAQVYNNVFFNMQHRAIFVGRGFNPNENKNVVIEHNTVLDAGLTDIQIQSGSPAKIAFNNNLSADPQGSGWSGNSNLIPSTADFTAVEPLTGFKLVEGSSAVNAATQTAATPTTDLLGNARPAGGAGDVGAIESR